MTDAPLCLNSKRPLPSWGTYGKHTVEVIEREISTTPDGTTTVHTLKGGTFCSSRCAADWLDGRQWSEHDTAPPCVAADDHRRTSGEDPF